MTNPSSSDIATASERVPLSYAQQLLCAFDAGEADSGPFGPRHNITWSWRARGPLDLADLTAALASVVARHEALRTRIVRDGGDLYQSVVAPSPAQVSEVDLSGVPAEARDRRAEELIVELEAAPHAIEPLPLIRAVVGRFDDEDAVVVLIAHHAAVDGWSMQVVATDLVADYSRRRGHQVAERPAPLQYRDYTLWQQGPDGVSAAALEYWRAKLQGGRMITLPMDHPRSADLPKNTAVLRYALDADLAAAVVAAARENRSSPFMVLLAAYNVLLARRTGVTDLVVPTIGANRKETRFRDTVGNFTNFMPLRTDLSGCADFTELLARVRATCLEAYSKEIPFLRVLGEAPELMAAAASDDECLVAFQVLQLPYDLDGESAGDLTLREIPRRLSQASSTEIPDGALWQFDVTPSDGIHAYLGYNTHKFEEKTLRALADEFAQVLRETVLDPHAPLRLGQSPTGK